MIVSLIAAMSKNLVIGKAQGLPWNLPVDLKRFKKITHGHPVIMGRKTLESIVRPLPGRENIIVSRQSTQVPGARMASSVEDALLPFRGTDIEVFILGGGQIFKEALPLADRIYQTLILHEIEGDTYFPEVDWSQFRMTFEQVESDPFPYVFRDYERIR